MAATMTEIISSSMMRRHSDLVTALLVRHPLPPFERRVMKIERVLPVGEAVDAVPFAELAGVFAAGIAGHDRGLGC